VLARSPRSIVLSSTGCGIIKPLRERRGEAEHAGFLVKQGVRLKA